LYTTQRYTFHASTIVARIPLDRDTYHSHSRAYKLRAPTQSDDHAGETMIADVDDSRKMRYIRYHGYLHIWWDNPVSVLFQITSLSFLIFLKLRQNERELRYQYYEKRAIERWGIYKPIMRPVSWRGNRISKHVRR